jgi:Protein kinase domain
VSDQLVIGGQLGNYLIDSVIGRGGMSVVYRAKHARLGMPVALKVLAPELSTDDSFRERFLREAQMAAAVDHPNVIPIHDMGVHDNSLYIVMRYVAGGDLKAMLLSSGVLEPERALELLMPIAMALDAAHAAGLVHRDVKPANILLQRSSSGEVEHVYLTDFGIAKSARNMAGLTGAGAFIGTVEYMAPEQLAGREVSAQTDVYALGATFYECLIGRIPFQREISEGVRPPTGPVESVSAMRPQLPVALDPVISKALSKNPLDRYDTCEQFLKAARAALDSPAPEVDRLAPAAAAAAATALSAGGETAAPPPSAFPPPVAVPPPPAPPTTPPPAVPPPAAPPPEMPPAAATPPVALPVAAAKETVSPSASEVTPAGSEVTPPRERTNQAPPAFESPAPPPAKPPPVRPAGAGSEGGGRGGRIALVAGVVAVIALVAVAVVVLTGGGSSTPPGALSASPLAPVPTNRVTGSGNVTVRLNGDNAAVTITTNGLDNGAALAHALHIHAGGKGECPPASAARPHNGHLTISTTDGINYYGPPVQALTTTGDTSPTSILAFPRFPTGGDIDYKRTIILPAKVAEAIREDNAVIVVHGIDYDGSGIYSGVLDKSDLNPALPGTATAPALCGKLVGPTQAASAKPATYTASIEENAVLSGPAGDLFSYCEAPEALSPVSEPRRQSSSPATA